MRPRLILPRWPMQRKNVVLPEPLGPMTQTTSLRCTCILTPRKTSLLWKYLCTSTASTIGRVPLAFVPVLGAAINDPSWLNPSQSGATLVLQRDRPKSRCGYTLAKQSPIPGSTLQNRRVDIGGVEPALDGGLYEAPDGRQQEIPEAGDDQQFKCAKERAANYLRRVEQLRQAGKRYKRATLEHVVELIAQGWNDDSERLRQNDTPHRQPIGHTQRPRGLKLPGLDRIDAGAHNLGHIRTLI